MNSTEYSPRDLIGYGEDSPDPKWPGGARIAVNFVLNYEEGSEVSPVNGDNIAESLASEVNLLSIHDALHLLELYTSLDLDMHR